MDPLIQATVNLRRRLSKATPVSRLAVSPTEAAQMLGVGRTTFYAWIKEGRIQRTKIGHRSFIKISDIRALLNGGQ